MFIRIEPASSVPIYAQILEQIRYQAAAGFLKPGDKVPSGRDLAVALGVNQHTVLKVYKELCAQGILQIERGAGTFVADGANSQKAIPAEEKKRILSEQLGQAAVTAIHLEFSLAEAVKMFEDVYVGIQTAQDKSTQSSKE